MRKKVTDVLVQGSEFRLECQDAVLDCFLHFGIRWKCSVADDYCLRQVLGVVHGQSIARDDECSPELNDVEE